MNKTALIFCFFASFFWSPNAISQKNENGHTLGKVCSMGVTYLIETSVYSKEEQIRACLALAGQEFETPRIMEKSTYVKHACSHGHTFSCENYPLSVLSEAQSMYVRLIETSLGGDPYGEIKTINQLNQKIRRTIKWFRYAKELDETMIDDWEAREIGLESLLQ